MNIRGGQAMDMIVLRRFFRSGHFSMVFLHEYRILLSLLYNQEITAQRPHWVSRIDKVDTEDQNTQILRLMGISRPGGSNWESPFRVYDKWVVADEQQAIDLMKQEDFSPDRPIILAQNPRIMADSELELEASARLTGKTADTMTLHVNTNKPSIVLIPEVFHRNWYAWV
jgi:hypothetical protein